MTDIPIKAKVECSDGPCGSSTNVIVNPVTKKVTHIVVQDKSLPDNPTRIVPVEQVAGTTEKQIKLSCTKAEVAKMSPFIITRLIRESGAGQAYASGEAYTSQYVLNDTAYDSVQEEQVPMGELAIHSGMQVAASDGKVGKLDELVLDPKSGEITHLQLREGHLWSKKEVAVPVADIDFIDGDTVYLKIDKAAAKALPTVSVKRPAG